MAQSESIAAPATPAAAAKGAEANLSAKKAGSPADANANVNPHPNAYARDRGASSPLASTPAPTRPPAPLPVTSAQRAETAPTASDGALARKPGPALTLAAPVSEVESKPAEVTAAGADPNASKEVEASSAKAMVGSAKLMRARSFRLNREWAKAIPLYEDFIAENRDSIDLPYALLELGRTYAQVGATEAALTRFYMVLDMAVYVDSPSIVQAREVSYSAQYDIAQIQMELGNYGQAARLFRGMHKLPLKAEDLANVYLNCARALKLSGDKFGAANEYRSMVELFSDNMVLAEARFELAVLYAELGRRDEALQQVLAFFERQKNSGIPDEAWRYWQRRAGNQLANMFYSAGNLPEAAELYGKLLQLSSETRWRWPLLYQVGLVAEQMKDLAKAKAVFTELAEAKAEGLPSDVAELPKLAQWRLEHLNWSDRIDTELKSLKPEA
ncbi:MAG: tetratricopeptide repeat protein [Opitutaceae bacterium]